MSRPNEIRPAGGKLGVLFPGMGSVATTTIAGVCLARRGRGLPIGSLTQMGRIPIGGRVVPIRDHVPLATLSQLEFGGWDILPENALEIADHAKVLERHHLEDVAPELRAITPMPGVFYPGYAKRLAGTHVKSALSKADMVEKVRDDIRAFKQRHGCARLVAIWCGSTETYLEETDVHRSVSTFEEGLRRSDAAISNAQIYAWACIKEHVPFANGAPHLGVDFPAAWELAREHRTPIAGKDFKTGQTLLKTALAPALKARMLGLAGWYSANILGNGDGEVLEDPGSRRTKEVSKLGVLEPILEPELYEELYGRLVHKIRIDYYPPRGDAKEAWDNIDLFGWLGYPMQIKVNFLCRDSILAAPVVLDLALFLDLAQRAGLYGPQDWLGFYFKTPMSPAGHPPEHDLFAQLAALRANLRFMTGDGPAPRGGEERVD